MTCMVWTECNFVCTWMSQWLRPTVDQPDLKSSNYFCIIWGGACRTTLVKTDALQRKALKAIMDVRQHTSTSLIYREVQVLTVSQLYELQVKTFMSKHMNLFLPDPLLGLLQNWEEIVTRQTRCDSDSNHDYYTHAKKLTVTTRSFIFQGPISWNQLPAVQVDQPLLVNSREMSNHNSRDLAIICRLTTPCMWI